MSVQAVKSWVVNPNTGLGVPLLTAEEARLILDHLDHVRAAGLLSDEDWATFREGQHKLLLMEIGAAGIA